MLKPPSKCNCTSHHAVKIFWDKFLSTQDSGRLWGLPIILKVCMKCIYLQLISIDKLGNLFFFLKFDLIRIYNDKGFLIYDGKEKWASFLKLNVYYKLYFKPSYSRVFHSKLFPEQTTLSSNLYNIKHGLMRSFRSECNIASHEWATVCSVFIDGGRRFGEMKRLKTDCTVRMLHYNRQWH